jgi:hypothetical protein
LRVPSATQTTATTTSGQRGGDVVRVVRDAAELDALREALLSDLGSGPLPDLDILRAVVETRDDVRHPHVLLLERDGRTAAVLLARLEEGALPARVGYWTLFRPRVRSLTVATNAGAGADADQATLVGHLLGALRRGEADVVQLQHAPVGSALHAAALAAAPGWSRQRFVPRTAHWVIDVPPTAEELHKAIPKSVRDNLRRYSRKLAREYGDRLEIRCYDAPEHLDAVLGDVEAVAAASYQRGLGAGFDAERDAPFVRMALVDGWFRAWVLYLDGKPCAFETGYVSGTSVVIAAKGFDPEHGRRHVGKVLQLHILESISADPVLQTVDFGFGDADYKQRLANRDWIDVDLVFYGRTPRGLFALAGRTAILAADRVARRAADQFAGEGRLAQLKRRWRSARTPAS